MFVGQHQIAREDHALVMRARGVAPTRAACGRGSHRITTPEMHTAARTAHVKEHAAQASSSDALAPRAWGCRDELLPHRAHVCQIIVVVQVQAVQEVVRTRVIGAQRDGVRARAAVQWADTREQSGLGRERVHKRVLVLELGVLDEGPPLCLTEVCAHQPCDSRLLCRDECAPPLLTSMAEGLTLCTPRAVCSWVMRDGSSCGSRDSRLVSWKGNKISHHNYNV
mmetsp:Transcript_20890/g.53893  ORF Transcript_20890/g.53893 Transcript_20890/m.53893 type:complete len:224 (+) Transcript_20890:316-987(+)